MEKTKKVNVNMNPKKVQNPNDRHKRNPGKFDQKVYMEQENYSAHAIQEMARIHSMQVQSVNLKFDKDSVAMKKKQRTYDHKNQNYAYLKQLRNAFSEETERRDSIARKLENFMRKQAEPSPEPEVEVVEVIPEKNYKPWENVRQPTIYSIQKDNTRVLEGEKCRTQLKSGYLQTGSAQGYELLDNPTNRNISSSAKNKLEKLSKDIITATLPVNRLKRIIPSEERNPGQSYPIMSYYRKSTILPQIRKIKRKLPKDTHHLHLKINQYFGTHLSLSSYFIPKSAKPHKQRLLKAISNDNFSLPQIPPELR